MVNRLSQYIGQEIIRTGPNRVTGDRSYLDDAIVLKEFTSKGEMIFYYPSGSDMAIIFGTGDRKLDLSFTDEQWKLFSKVLKPKGNDLNRYIGKKIQRICPATYSNGSIDTSYMNDKEPKLELVSATKYHLVVRNIYWNKNQILPFEFAKPEDWVLAE